MKKTKKLGMALGVVLTFGAMLASCGSDEVLSNLISDPVDDGITYTAEQVGGASGSVTTSAIKLNFAADVSDLSVSNIRIEGDAVTPGVLNGSGKVWTLDLNKVAEEREVTLVVNKDGIAKTGKQVRVYKGEYTLAGDHQPDSATDLKIRFGTTGVTETFNALHNLITSPSTDDKFTDIIQLGDWVDLPSLHVTGYPDDIADHGKIAIANNTTWDGNHGELLRLIVVGKNSFNNINGNGTTPHVVFQFQNVPGTHRMEETDTNQNGYLGSEMRTYLVDKFLTGLINAGVPDAVLWTPSRRVPNKGEGATAADTITDKLWLPTNWEMFGAGAEGSADPTYETANNQASFADFYSFPLNRKYNALNDEGAYWLASPCFYLTRGFCYSSGGSIAFFGAQTALSVAPAFCVR
jgi:hypothetical protein